MSKKLEKLDPRVIRTRQMLCDALVSLIAEKGFDAITVQDIADRATLNRATFYLHYQDKHDLLVKSLRNAIDELMTDIGASTDEQGQLIFESPLRPIKTIFEHVAQHARFYQVMLSAEGVPAFSAGVRDYMAEVTLRWLSATQPQPQRSRVPLEIVASSLSWSLLGILIWWLEHDMPHSPEYMAGQFRLLITLDLRQVLGLEPADAESRAVS
jgi:AcrR family transcriptional regulator